jgi:hypothetical protein
VPGPAAELAVGDGFETDFLLTFRRVPNGIVLSTAQLRGGNFALVEFATGVEQIGDAADSPPGLRETAA